jgi:S-DNA-T family DNA segregation ATPase FtsK/SpoIIIE
MNIQSHDELEEFFLYGKYGIKKIKQSKTKLRLFVIMVIGFIILIFQNKGAPIVIDVGLSIIVILFICYLWGHTWGAGKISLSLKYVGLIDSGGNTPLLVEATHDPENCKVQIWRFVSKGIPLTAWQNKKEQIESALNVHIVQIQQGRQPHDIILTTVSADCTIPDKADWQSECLQKADFVLGLGEDISGDLVINLNRIPHILIGGSTGSGKTLLLKLLLMQSLQKGAIVYIADLKGGVDFSKVWQEKCSMAFDAETVIKVLNDITNELENRKAALNDADCANIRQYNNEIGYKYPHIIFACDEIAELLDKTGLDKTQKEQTATIERLLSLIARQGRAFGIHLILATQRPDANVLPGQIKNNIDCRICGRADNVLSQIILDNTSAAEQIPKDAQGRFITQDGHLFQAYLFDENAELHNVPALQEVHPCCRG